MASSAKPSKLLNNTFDGYSGAEFYPKDYNPYAHLQHGGSRQGGSYLDDPYRHAYGPSGKLSFSEERILYYLIII